MSERTETTRRYHSEVRRRRAAETRDRIVIAGRDLLHRSPIREWRDLTIRGVARQAGVSERTVYRYFCDERELRDAVMRRLEEEAGIDLAGMHLGDIGQVAGRIFDHVAPYPREARPPLDPTLKQANLRQRHALLEAIAECTEGWSADEQASAAAVFDILWSVAPYERLVIDWEMDHRRAAATLAWAISLMERAVRAGERPPVGPLSEDSAVPRPRGAGGPP